MPKKKNTLQKHQNYVYFAETSEWEMNSMSEQGKPVNYNYHSSHETSVANGNYLPYVEIVEQPSSVGARFRYKCEGRTAGCIRGTHTTEKNKTYPTIKIVGYQGIAVVLVSCVTKDGPPYYPHPHNLVGKSCVNGVCYKSVNHTNLECSFPDLGIQCVKRKDIKDSLLLRKKLQIDPFGTGFSHHAEPNKINLNALRLCFQVFLPDPAGKFTIPLPPVISCPICDNKTVSNLTIVRLSHYSAPVTGGKEIILLCNQVNKDDIEVLFYEESGSKIIWSAQGQFSPHHVHRKAAITFRTPAYRQTDLQESTVECFVVLRRPSDGAVGKAEPFKLLPLTKDPEGLARKRSKFESLSLERVLQPNNLACSNEGNIVPRVIKQAARSRTNPAIGHSDSNFVPERIECMQQPSVEQNCGSYNGTSPGVASSEADLSQNTFKATASTNPQLYSSTRKVDDLLAIAAQEIGIQNPVEVSVDDTLDKLSSLDLGLDSDLDVNLSGIVLDSFSECSGLNISLQSVDVKNSG